MSDQERRCDQICRLGGTPLGIGLITRTDLGAA
jgi:hypothetical protein